MKNHLGIYVRYMRGPSFEAFSIGYHSHFEDDEDNCVFRKGIFVTFCNLSIGVGMFRK